MRHVHLPVTVSLLVVSSLLSWNCATATEKIFRVSDGAVVSLPEVIKDLKESQFVFVGELHTRQAHHEAQLEVIRALKQANTPVAVGLEMFRRESQPDLDRWQRGDLSEEAFKKIFYENWNYPWPLYRRIFLFSRDHKIRLIGLNVARELTRQVAGEGFASLSPEQRGDLPMVSCRVDPEYMAFIRRSLGMHGHGGMNFVNFCEAQLLWDTVMAWNLLRFVEKNPDSTTVVLAGSGHAWKRGIPAQIRSRSDYSFRVILPEIPGRVEQGKTKVEEADYIWMGLE